MRDAVERRARLRVLERAADERPLAVRPEHERDRPLGRHEREARVVEDVVRVEEDDAGKAVRPCALEEGVAAGAMLVRRDRDRGHHGSRG